MTQSVTRPYCLACRQMFSDEDVAAGNYAPIVFDVELGPSFHHKKCPGIDK